MRKMKKFLAVILSVTMIFGALSVNAGAVDEKVIEDLVTAGTNFIKAIAEDISGDIKTLSEEFEVSIDDFKSVKEQHGIGAAFIKTGLNCGNILLQSLLRRICDIHSDPVAWKDISEYSAEKENIYAGRENYQTVAKTDAQWELGYASASVIPDDFKPWKYSLGRTAVASVLFQPAAKAKSILDDQRVRAICVDDGSGEGAVVIAVIDGLGVGSGTIRAIREQVETYAKQNNIDVASINVSATHAHSALDTQGVSTSLPYSIVTGFFNNNKEADKVEVAFDEFNENLVNVSAQTIINAIDDMETGTLYYDSADVSSCVHDKRYMVEAPEMGILHFVPDDETSDETYLANISCHPTSVSGNNGAVSGDYIYYMDKNFQAEEYNFILVQGAVGLLTRDVNIKDFATTKEELESLPKEELSAKIKANNLAKVKELVKTKYQGELKADNFHEDVDAFYEDLIDTIALADTFTDIIFAATADGEEELAPIINVKHDEITFKTTNYLLRLACQVQLVNNVVYKTGDGVDDAVMPSEVGYVEFGRRMAFGLYPCELYPEVFHGGAVSAENAWTGKDWEYDPMPETVANEISKDIDLYAICFANDYIGYVVPDNYYAFFGHMIDFEADQNYWKGNGCLDEMLSAGRKTASTIVTGFQGLVGEIKAELSK